jgi:hypothetical protein
VIAVAVRTPGAEPGERRQQIRKYKTYHQVLGQMVAWPAEPGVTHVGIYLGNGYMINAPNEDEVIKIESISIPFWTNHLAGFGRVQGPGVGGAGGGSAG